MTRDYRSPLTGDPWTDARPAIGTIAGLANFLNEQRPRRRPPSGQDDAIAQAAAAAAGLAGLPTIARFGPEGLVLGPAISDAYWKAKEAKAVLNRIVDDGVFLQRQEWWGREWQRWQEQHQHSDADPDSWNSRYFERHRGEPVTYSQCAARLAWYAANLAEKFGAGATQMQESYGSTTYAHDAVLGAIAEVDAVGVSREAAQRVERVWRFVVAAGRMPVPGVDDDLLAAFEAALMVGENAFAHELVRDT